MGQISDDATGHRKLNSIPCLDHCQAKELFAPVGVARVWGSDGKARHFYPCFWFASNIGHR